MNITTKRDMDIELRNRYMGMVGNIERYLILLFKFVRMLRTIILLRVLMFIHCE